MYLATLQGLDAADVVSWATGQHGETADSRPAQRQVISLPGSRR